MRRLDLPYRLCLALMVALLLGAFFVRVHALATTPPGIAFDTTWDFADALRISRGIPFPAVFDTRPEPAHRFFLAGWSLLTGLYPFTLILSSVLIGTFTVALTYQVGRTLLAGRAWRRVGALVAAGSLAAMMPHLFLSRVTYRGIILPAVILAALLLLLRASRSGHGWAWGGFAAAMGVHVYLAGIMTPLWGVGFVLHQTILAKKRLRLRHAVYALAGMVPALVPWLALIALVPGLFFRVGEAGSKSTLPLTTQLINGLRLVPVAFFVRGFNLPLYDTPNEPFLNPALALLAFMGIALALWRWRTAEGALLLGALLAFSVPAALSEDATHPVRLVGAMPILALLAGWGTAWALEHLLTLGYRLRPTTSPHQLKFYKTAAALLVIVLVSLSLAGTHLAYQAMFADPARYAAPNDWLSIPHNYTIALLEALDKLTQVDQPTYVPLTALDNPAAMFVLQRAAYPNVTTWARYGLKQLPAGQIFYPTLYYYHTPLATSDALQVLLLPAEKTMVILPGNAGAPVITAPTDGQDIVDTHGWVIAHTAPVAARPLTPPALITADVPVMGDGVRFVTGSEAVTLERGQPANVLLYWQITTRQPADLFTFAQLVGLDWNAYGSSDHHVLAYLYPSALWQPGDIIPDLHPVPVPDQLPDGVYRWAAGAYVPPGQARLSVITPHGESFPLANTWVWDTLRLPLPARNAALPADATPLQVQFDDGIALEGYHLAPDAAVWTLTLYWRANTQPGGSYTIFVHLAHDDQQIAQQDTQPQNGALPTWAWQPGELVTTTHTLTLPAGAASPNRIYVGMYSYPSLQRLAVQTSAVPAQDNRVQVWIAP